MVFHILIFAVLVLLKRPYVEMYCTKYHPDRSNNVESADRNSLSPLSTERLKLTQFHQRLLDYFYGVLFYQISSYATENVVGQSGSDVLVLLRILHKIMWILLKTFFCVPEIIQ
jgi:hypothetical protein